jgi:hypothetical protein
VRAAAATTIAAIATISPDRGWRKKQERNDCRRRYRMHHPHGQLLETLAGRGISAIIHLYKEPVRGQ